MNERCGTCHFAKIVAQDITKRVCFGAPPSALQTPSPSGQMTLRMARPIVSVTDDACALYRDKDHTDKARDASAIQILEDMKQPETKQ